MDVTATEIERRLAFVQLDAKERQALAALAPVVGPAAARIADAFFASLARLPEADGLTKNRTLLERARSLKIAHLHAMTSGTYDEKYVKQRLELASVYAAAGLDPAVFVSAFQVLLREIDDVLRAAFPGDNGGRFTTFRKLAFFDIGLIVDGLVDARERTIHAQAEAIRELSTPVLRIRDRLLVLPIVGVIDNRRAIQIMESLLSSVRVHRAKVAIVDVTGASGVDSKVADHLLKAARAARMMGAHVMLTGIAPDVAQALIAIGVALDDVITVGDLQAGVELADALEGEAAAAAE